MLRYRVTVTVLQFLKTKNKKSSRNFIYYNIYIFTTVHEIPLTFQKVTN